MTNWVSSNFYPAIIKKKTAYIKQHFAADFQYFFVFLTFNPIHQISDMKIAIFYWRILYKTAKTSLRITS